MAATTLPDDLKSFAGFIQANAPLAPFTQLKIGGPAELLVQPSALDELIAFVKVCFAKQLRFRILGSGGNVLVHDEGVKGIVLRLAGPVVFRQFLQFLFFATKLMCSLCANAPHPPRASRASVIS